MIALPSTFARAANSGIKSRRSITAAAVTGSLINNHSASAATGASVTDVMLSALNTRGQKRLFWGCLGRSVEGLKDAMNLISINLDSDNRTSVPVSCNPLIN